MPLDWSVAKVKNYETVCFENDRMRPKTEALVFATMSVGLGRITKKNYLEFWYRLHLYEGVYSACRREADGEPKYFLLPDVEEHIGLHTNVSDVPFGKWSKALKDNYLRHLTD